MRRKTVPPMVWAALAIPVLWAAVLAAGGYESGMNLFQLLERLSAAAHLFSVRWTAYTPRFVLVFLIWINVTVNRNDDTHQDTKRTNHLSNFETSWMYCI